MKRLLQTFYGMIESNFPAILPRLIAFPILLIGLLLIVNVSKAQVIVETFEEPAFTALAPAGNNGASSTSNGTQAVTLYTANTTVGTSYTSRTQASTFSSINQIVVTVNPTSTSTNQTISTLKANASTSTSTVTTNAAASVGTWTWWVFGAAAIVQNANYNGGGGATSPHSVKTCARVNGGYLATPIITNGISQVTFWVYANSNYYVGLKSAFAGSTNFGGATAAGNMAAMPSITSGTTNTNPYNIYNQFSNNVSDYAGTSGAAGNVVQVTYTVPATLATATNGLQLAFWQGSNGVSIDDIVITSPITTPTIVLADNANGQVAAGNLGIGSPNNIIYNFQTAITASNATINTVNFTTTGTAVSGTDITNFKLYFSTTNNFTSPAPTLLGTITTSLGAGSHSFTGLTQSISNSSTGFFWITADIPVGATANNTISVSAITPANLTFASGTPTGSTSAGGTKTIIAPTITLADNTNGQVGVGNMPQNSINNIVYNFQTAVSVASATLNSIGFTTTGTATSGTDITNFKIYFSTTNSFTSPAPTLLGTITTSLGAGSHSLTGLSQSIPSGSTGFLWITADIPSGSTLGNTIAVSAIAPSDLTFAAGTPTGSTSAGGTQTIAAIPPTIVLADNSGGQVAAGNITTGSANNIILNFQTAITTANAIINTVNFTTTGTAVSGTDITIFKLYFNTTNSFAGASSLGTLSTALGAGSHSFTGLTQSIAQNTTGFFWITADLPISATAGNTIAVSAMSSGAIVFASGTPTGSTSAGGTQTILAGIDYYNTGNVAGNVTSNWTTSNTGAGGTLLSAGSNNFTSGDRFHVRNTTTVTTSGTWTISGSTSQLIIETGGTLTLSNPLNISGQFNNNGTFNNGGQTVTFGTGGVIGGTVASTFAGLTINTTASTDIVSVTKSPVTVANGSTLTLTKGIFKLGTGNTLSLGPTATSTISAVGGSTSNFANASLNNGTTVTGLTDADGGTVQVGSYGSGSWSITTATSANKLVLYNLTLGISVGNGNSPFTLANSGSLLINGTMVAEDNNMNLNATSTPIYGPNSTLYINNNGQGLGSKNYWLATTGSVIGTTIGYPNNVTLVNVGNPTTVSQSNVINGVLSIGDGTTAGIVTISGGTAGAFFCGGLIINSSSTFTAPSSMTVKGKFINRAGTFTNSSGTIIMNGTGTSAAPDSIKLASGSFTNLSLSGANAYVKLYSPVTVTGIFTLPSSTNTPTLETDATNILTVTSTNNTAIAGGYASSFINGPVIWSLGTTANTTYTIPLGAGTTNYYPFAFSSSSTGTPTITAQAFAATPGTADNVTLDSTSVIQYWKAVTTTGFVANSFSIGRSTPASITGLNAIGKSTTNAATSFTNIDGTVGTLSGQNSVNTSSSGFSGAGTLYLDLAHKIPQTVTTGTVSPLSYCNGTSVSVPFTSTGGLSSFTAQLSDAGGSFTSPTTIGTGTSSPISAIISPTAVAGSGYRIRVISGAVIGTDNGSDISISGQIISLTSGSATPTVCSGTAIISIVYTISGTATSASLTSGTLPTGVTLNPSGSTYTISGTPTQSGLFPYTITTAGSSCTGSSLSGTITVNAQTISLSSAVGTNSQTICNNTAITNITYSVGGVATGAGVTGLPAGVIGTYSSGTFTISGTPALPGTYNYTVTTTGGSCTAGTATGSIIVNGPTLYSVPGSPVIRYDFTNGSVTDLGSTGDNAQQQGSPGTTTDRFGNTTSAYSLNGSSQYFTNASFIPPSVPHSEGVWFKTTTAIGGDLLGLNNQQTGNTASSYDHLLYMDPTGHINFGVWNGSTHTVITTPLTYNNGQWHSAVATISSANGERLYIDGNLVVNNSGFNTASSGGEVFWRIGSNPLTSWPNPGTGNGLNFFNGSLDDAVLYNVELTAAQVATLANIPTAVATPTCAGTGATVTVSSSTLATGTYTVTYNVSGTNTVSSTTASMNFTAGTPGTGTFTTAPLNTSGGSNTVNITSLSLNGCAANVLASTAGFAQNALPTVTFTTAPGANTCANSSVTYTTQTGQSSYVWSIPGTGGGVDYTITAGGIGSSNNTVTLTWITTGSKTVTVNYNNASGCTATSPASNTTTVNALPTATFTTDPGANTCVNSSVTYTTQTGQSSYLWSVPGTGGGVDYTITSGGIGSSSNTVTLTWITTGSKTVTVNYNNGSGCSATSPASNTTTVSANTFSGTGDYTNGANWSCGVPGTSDSVTIQDGSTVTFSSDYTLASAGRINVLPGTGTTINIAPNVALTIAGKMDLHSQHMIVQSDATGTASIGQTTGTLSNATNVTVERYIPANSQRAWRLLSIPTQTGQTIHQSWQENQAPGVVGTSGLGTNITSPIPGNGFDYVTYHSSMLKYNQGTNNWDSVTNTGDNITTTSGYFLYIRGDRNETPSAATGPTSATKLRTTGTLYQGTQSAISVPSGEFGLIGNVYASAIDFTALTKDAGIDNLYYVWDPKVLNLPPSLGAYVTFSSVTTPSFIPVPGGGSYTTGVQDSLIQSGEAFFVHASSTANIQLTEGSKVTGSQMVFRPESPSNSSGQLATNLYEVNGASANLADGNVEVFNSAYSNAVDGNDALKLSNTQENFGILRNNKVLIIEARQPVVTTDTIFFDMWNMNQQQYKLEFAPTNLAAAGITGVLEDSYLGTRTPINLTTTNSINFSVDGNAGSSVSNRFRIVFNGSSPVPVTFTSVSAYQKDGAGVEVEWKVAGENGIQQYVVEHSTDGVNFTKIGVVTAKNNNGGSVNYSLLDGKATNGNNYYRISSVAVNGSVKYTSIVKVTLGSTAPGIAIYPNPVTDGHITVELKNQPAGSYSVRLLNTAGQLIYKMEIAHGGGSSAQSVNVSSALAKGIYQLEVVTPSKELHVEKVTIK